MSFLRKKQNVKLSSKVRKNVKFGKKKINKKKHCIQCNNPFYRKLTIRWGFKSVLVCLRCYDLYYVRYKSILQVTFLQIIDWIQLTIFLQDLCDIQDESGKQAQRHLTRS